MPHSPDAVSRARVILEVDRPEQWRQFERWCRATGVEVAQLQNEGCGCCVDIYSLLAKESDLQGLNSALQACGAGVEYLTHPA